MFPHTGHSKPLQLEQRYPPAPIARDDRSSTTSLLHSTQRTVLAFLLQLEQRYPPAPIARDDRSSATSLLHFTQRTVFAFLLHPEHLKLIACDGRSSTTSLLHSTQIFVRAFLTHSAHLNALVVLVVPARDGLFIGTSLLHSKHVRTRCPEPRSLSPTMVLRTPTTDCTVAVSDVHCCTSTTGAYTNTP